jgi:hypothetical protein
MSRHLTGAKHDPAHLVPAWWVNWSLMGNTMPPPRDPNDDDENDEDEDEDEEDEDRRDEPAPIREPDDDESP